VTGVQTCALPIYLIFMAGFCAAGVTVTDDNDEGQAAFKIVTDYATYFFQKDAGGFSSLVDKDGNDWISYNATFGSGGTYRGIPNLVHPGDIFHPGHSNANSSLQSSSAEKATIISNSNDGKWSTQWDFYSTYAQLTVLKDDREFWFLYEGTPGGGMDPGKDYYLLSDGTTNICNVAYNSDLPSPEWIAFGDPDYKRLLFLMHHENDDSFDKFYTMEGNMTVFGFGRSGLTKYMQGSNTFSIGIFEDTSLTALSAKLDTILNGQTTLISFLPRPLQATGLTVRPNPAVRGMRIHLGLSKTSEVRVSILNATGNLVRTLHQGSLGKNMVWDGKNNKGKMVPPGFYVVTAKSGFQTLAKKVLITQ